ncbi:hypothetical protein H3T59_09060, partial [Commensalibacter sp. M0357]|nr:hypothetical protein [Commensalibacter sp. M0357]MBI0085591.1 hypothetical protein [Commensalibacter sp. M0355]
RRVGRRKARLSKVRQKATRTQAYPRKAVPVDKEGLYENIMFYLSSVAFVTWKKGWLI